MTKAYWVAQIDVTDPDAYEQYRAANADAFEKYGGHFLVRGGPQDVREGNPKSRTVVIEFADLDDATACYESPEYQRAKALRDPASEVDLVIVPGWDG